MRLERMGERALLVSGLADSPARLARALDASLLTGLEEAVPCYDSIGLYFRDFPKIAEVRDWLEAAESRQVDVESTPHQVPVCFELGDDLPYAAEELGLTPEAVVETFLAGAYTVEAIGFSPGFPYLSGLPLPLCGLARLPSPRVRVPAGSVGITGSQAGIYPQETPGGWRLIGRTPLPIVDLGKPWFRFAVGDQIQFFRIDREEHEAWR